MSESGVRVINFILVLLKRLTRTILLAGLSCCLISVLAIGTSVQAAEDQKPLNVILISLDDMQWQSFGYLDDRYVEYTPNLTALANESVAFLHSHVPFALCTPTRAAFMTGKGPLKTGVTTHLRHVFAGVDTLPGVLGEQGYLTGLIGKTRHTIPYRAHEFDVRVGPDQLSMGRSPQKFRTALSNLMAQAKDTDRPFFASINIHDPHTPYPGADTMDNIKSYVQFVTDRTGLANALKSTRLEYQGTTPGDPVKYDVADVPVFNFLPDLPEVRHEMTQYLTAVNRADQTIGQIVELLRESGELEQTMLFIFSDHGAAMPFSKQHVYANSTRSALLVRHPDASVGPYLDTKHLVSVLDIFPTVMESLGLPTPLDLDGVSLLPLLKDETYTGHDHLAAHYEAPNNPALPSRAIFTTDWGYVFNAWPDGEVRASGHWRSSESFQGMRRAAQTNPDVAERVQFELYRTQEELYDYTVDIDAKTNLASQPVHAAKRDEMRLLLVQNMLSNNDPLFSAYCRYLLADDFGAAASLCQAPAPVANAVLQ